MHGALEIGQTDDVTPKQRDCTLHAQAMTVAPEGRQAVCGRNIFCRCAVVQDHQDEDVGEEAASFWGQVSGPVHDDHRHA